MLTNYAINLMADAAMRGQTITFPATRYVALFTGLPTRAGGGTELVAAGYSRVAVASSLANWSGTQGAGTTSASSGSSAQITNNVAVSWGVITVAWNLIAGFGLYDAASGGNLWDFGYIVDADGDSIKRSFGVGDTVSFDPGTLVLDFA
jgi:hypothetical protein